MSDEAELNINELIEETKGAGDVSIERTMCINAIMSTEFIKGCSVLLKDLTLIESPMCRTILQWNIEYFKKYSISMQETVKDIYKSKRPKLSEVVSKDINDFLDSISQQYATGNHYIHNVKLELDLVEDYLDLQAVVKLNKGIEKTLLTGNVTKAKQLVHNFKQVKQAPKASVNAFKDFSRFREKLSKDTVLFNMPEPFNDLYGPICTRHLSGVCAASKVGKSRSMAWFVCQALKAGKAVFIGSLEMEESEFLSLIDYEMLREDLYGGEGHIPVFKGSGDNTIISHQKLLRDPATPEELEAKYKGLGLFNPTASLHIKAWPQFSCSIDDDLVPELDRIKEVEGINIEIIALDYADLLKENKGDEREPTRIKVANKWRALKKLAQERLIHLHTASQLGKEGQLFESTTKAQDSNFLIKLEQNAMEKRLGIYRQSVMYHRGIPYDPSRPLISLSNNGIGLFNLDAKWSSEEWDYLPDVDENMVLWKTYTGEEWREEVEYDYPYEDEYQANLHRNDLKP